MKLRGQCELPAPPVAVWHFLANPDQVSQCVPGLTAWETITPNTHFRLWLRLPFAPPAQPPLPITLAWGEQQHATSLQLLLTTQFGLQSVQATTQLTLHPLAATQTQLHFLTVITTDNRFIQQMLRHHSPKLIDSFFVTMQQRLQP
ncbi:MAG: hypothetical protein KDE56_30140 [Anaerolineales bacterium]|nr:hypothetical protein [Anaerolineales bacterium]